MKNMGSNKGDALRLYKNHHQKKMFGGGGVASIKARKFISMTGIYATLLIFLRTHGLCIFILVVKSSFLQILLYLKPLKSRIT